MSSKYGNLIDQARKPENQKAGKPEKQTGEPKQQERDVNLCVKVPESMRRHWAAESKRQGVTMTSVIVEALTDKFGIPD